MNGTSDEFDDVVVKLVAQAECEPRDVAPANTDGTHNYFRSAEWSPDGTCLITNSSKNKIETFIVPPELLDDREDPLQLQPYSSIPSQEAADAITCFPAYDLQNTSTTLVLSAVNEHPIRLNSVLTGSLVASYPLVDPNTEAFIKPQTMIFTDFGDHFLAGSTSMISQFDVSRPGNGPVCSFKTGSRRKVHAMTSNPATSLRGLISALAVDNQYNILAVGTLSRQVGIYDAAGMGDCVAVFALAGTDADNDISGNGVIQLAWSRCGRYLYIVERKSNGILTYDIRSTGALLSWTVGREAVTNQRMKVDFATNPTSGKQETWAGGQDGMLRQWQDVQLQQGPIAPSRVIGVHKATVNSIGLHPSANVVLTACGQREMSESGFSAQPVKSTDFGKQSSVKLWQI